MEHPASADQVQNEFSERYRSLRRSVDGRLLEVVGESITSPLAEPTRYVVESGGKRVRAVLVMFAASAVGGNGPDALDAGVAVEMLHNFTLVHDDIMDRAATRRGRPTVHTVWNQATAILVGDAMIGLALRTLGGAHPAAVASFAQGLIDVCDGQALDAEYETRRDITIEDYLTMIALKTGRLLETAAEIGAIVGGGSPAQIDALRGFARNLGLAFQIQDDLLDITADEATLGKRIGGDVVEGKRTYLLVRALDRVDSGDDRALLDVLLENNGLDSEKIDAMRDLYQRNGIVADAREDVRRYIDRAGEHLAALPPGDAVDMLHQFSAMLLQRNS